MQRSRSVLAVSLTAVAVVATQLGSVAYAHDAVNFQPPGTFRIAEDDGAAGIVIQRGTHGQGPASVTFSTSDGGALAGSDYTAVESAVPFTDPVETAEALVPIVDDSSVEGLESLGLHLSDPSAGMVLAFPQEGLLTIIDDDGASRVGFEQTGYSAFETRKLLELWLIRSGDDLEAASIAYATQDGSATAGSDFTAKSGSVTFEPGQRAARVTLVLTDDTEIEGDESFTVVLADPSGAEIDGSASVEVLLRDDEGGATDTTAPYTAFHQPLDGKSYRPKQIEDFLVFMQDDDQGSGMALVEISLRKTLTNGRCAWWTGAAFDRGSCDKIRWSQVEGDYFTDVVLFELATRLKPSTPAKGIRFYTAYSRGIDKVGNVQTVMDKGQNRNRFEVRMP